MSPSLYLLAQVTIIAYGLTGGVFLAFLDFLMRSYAKTPAANGVETMQVINREVFRWVFMTLFMGLAPVSALLIWGGMSAESGGSLLVLAGVTYLIGCFGVTITCNVPMNNALESMDATTKAGQTYWLQTYLPRWTVWNTVRTVACICAACFTLLEIT